MSDLVFAPGVVKEKTSYDVGFGFTDSNLIRWRNGQAAPIGGWLRRGTSVLTGVCRTIKEFSNNSGVDLVGFGTNSNAFVMSSDNLYDITPDGFVPGLVDAGVSDGYGIGAYGVGTYGTPRTPSTDPFAQVIEQPLIWSIDNFGEDLILNPYSDVANPGHIYIWHATGGFGRKATLLSAEPGASHVPEFARGTFVSAQAECVVALGCCPYGSREPDPMMVRWSDFGNPTNWNPTNGDNAGGYRLPSGSYIIGYLNTYFETLIFTDTTVYSMQLLTNGLAFGFPPVGQGMSIISPKSSGTNGSTTFWMDKGSFYQYTGSMSELVCPLKFFLFGDHETQGDINQLQAFKIFSAHNHSYSEMWWFYASIAGTEIDSYVMYNYRDGVWANGKLSRTAWSDSGHASEPIATDAAGLIYAQEFGTDGVDGLNVFALPWSLTTGGIVIDSGDTYVLLQRIRPDFLWTGNIGDLQQINIDIRTQETPSSTPRVAKTITMVPTPNNGGYADLKTRGRIISLRIYSNGSPGSSFILGKLAAQFFPNGTR